MEGRNCRPRTKRAAVRIAVAILSPDGRHFAGSEKVLRCFRASVIRRGREKSRTPAPRSDDDRAVGRLTNFALGVSRALAFLDSENLEGRVDVLGPKERRLVAGWNAVDAALEGANVVPGLHWVSAPLCIASAVGKAAVGVVMGVFSGHAGARMMTGAAKSALLGVVTLCAQPWAIPLNICAAAQDGADVINTLLVRRRRPPMRPIADSG
jgi:hypothetical protein